MTDLLQQAFDKATQLPAEEQDQVALWLLFELDTEKRWKELFEQSPNTLVKLADEALDEHEKGMTQTLDPDML